MAIKTQPLSKIKGSRVFVYRNLHQDCWSVKDRKSGRVVAHADSVTLSGVDFKVSEAGRQKVLEKKRKGVHAGLVGNLTHYTPKGSGIPGKVFQNGEGKGESKPEVVGVTYNPYKYSTFVVRETEQPIQKAETATLQPNKQVLAVNPSFFEEGIIA